MGLSSLTRMTSCSRYLTQAAQVCPSIPSGNSFGTPWRIGHSNVNAYAFPIWFAMVLSSRRPAFVPQPFLYRPRRKADDRIGAHLTDVMLQRQKKLVVFLLKLVRRGILRIVDEYEQPVPDPLRGLHIVRSRHRIRVVVMIRPN